MRALGLLLSVTFAGVIGLGATAASSEQDRVPFQDLIPGVPLSDAELGSFYGTGVTSTSSNASSEGVTSGLSLLSGRGRNLRTVLMGGFKRAGLQPPLAPSGPNGTAGSGRLATPDLPSHRLEVPRIPMPSVRGSRLGTSSGSFSGSSSTSSF